MANPKSKILPRVLSTFVVVLLFYCVDAFAPQIMSDLLFGSSVVGGFLGIVTIISVCFVKHIPLSRIGIIFDPGRLLRGLLVGGSMSVLPIVSVFVGQILIFKLTGITTLAPSFTTPGGDEAFSLTNIVIVFASCGICSLMQEMTFRGYVMRTMRPQYPFTDANLFQSTLSLSLPLVLVVRNLVYGHYSSRSGLSLITFLVVSVLFYLAYTFISSVKRGFVTRVSGDIWPSVFGNFFFMFLGGSLFVQNGIILSYSSMIRLMLAEIISMIIAVVYYNRQYSKNKKRKEDREKHIAQRIEKIRREEQERGDDPDLEGLNKKSVKEIMEDHNKKIMESVGSHSKKIHPESDDGIADLPSVASKKKMIK